MKINNIQTQAYKPQQSSGNKPAFKGTMSEGAKKVFETVGEHCNISPNGSLTRLMFFLVGVFFMLGGRVMGSRTGDEKREIITRDVPAIALSCAGAPFLNQFIAQQVTKSSGIPIVTNGKNFSFKNTAFTNQKQLTDWYSDLKTAENPLINLSKNTDTNGGNIRKLIRKFGFEDKLNAITAEVENSKIISALEEAQKGKNEAFFELEKALKGVKKDNPVLSFAKKSQAAVKLGGIGFMAFTLGYLLPRLNIVITRKKIKEELASGKINKEEAQKLLMRKSPAYRICFHNASAVNTFRNLLSMAEPSSHFE